MSQHPARRATSPSPLPPHIRPSLPRHNSSSSTSSTRSNRPYPQQREYVPSNLEAGFASDAVDERWAFEQAEQPTPARPGHRSAEDEVEEEEEEDDNGSEADWNAAKEADHAGKPAWRRASPRWLYPFVSGATLAMGMGLAPRSELYINLACLAHPPQSSGTGLTAATMCGIRMFDFHTMYAESMRTTVGINGTDGEISPSDKWFYKIQKDIYDYEYRHSHHIDQPTWTTSLPVPTQPSTPSESVPRPIPSEKEGAGKSDDTPPPYRQIDPKVCKKDPAVQAAAARLVMLMTVTMGILSALTTGYWGQMSDRIGRTKIMALMETGLLVNEICFILVATFPYRAPGGYRALLIGPTLEGLLGGYSILTATVNAYVSDTTPDGSRASTFARLGGVFMLGIAFGPVIGSFVIRATGNIMSPFYLNIGIHIFYISMILLVLPESLSKEARTILVKNAKLAADAQREQDSLAREWENETPVQESSDPFLATPAGESGWSLRAGPSSRRQKKVMGMVRRGFRKSTAFLRPLGVFMPTRKEEGGWDWNMTITGAALYLMSFMMGIYQVKAQYTIYTFGWTSAQLGPYMSFVGFAKGFVMLVILPLAMRLAKPYFMAPPSPEAATSSFSAISTPDNESTPLLPTPTKRKRPATLDLWTARISLAFESGMYLILSLAPPEIVFIILTGLVTLAAGAGPAANSLALSFIPNSREAGKLFGGVAVLSALGSTLLGPLAFGTLFSYTVGTFTPAVWVLAGVIQGVSLLLMCFVRIPGEKEGGEERGRSKRVKTVRSSSGLRE